MQLMARLMSELAPNEGVNATCLPGVHVFRSSTNAERGPMCYSQGVLIVGQGKKRVYIDDKTYDYDSHCESLAIITFLILCFQPIDYFNLK